MYQELIDKKAKLAVIGLGYVGLPIALEFAKKISVIGFDINAKKSGDDEARVLIPAMNWRKKILKVVIFILLRILECIEGSKFFYCCCSHAC